MKPSSAFRMIPLKEHEIFPGSALRIKKPLATQDVSRHKWRLKSLVLCSARGLGVVELHDADQLMRDVWLLEVSAILGA